jgi:hypothetical protein
MYSKSQLIKMNYDRNYSSSSWINNINSLDDKKLYNLHATTDASLSSGRKYVAIPSDIKLSAQDNNNYKIMK